MSDRPAIVADGPDRLRRALAELPPERRAELRRRLDAPARDATSVRKRHPTRLVAALIRSIRAPIAPDRRCFVTPRSDWSPRGGKRDPR